MNETLARSIVLALAGLALILAWKLTKALWRAVRGIKAENVARTAGALTSAAEARAGSIKAAFKHGRYPPQ